MNRSLKQGLYESSSENYMSIQEKHFHWEGNLINLEKKEAKIQVNQIGFMVSIAFKCFM